MPNGENNHLYIRFAILLNIAILRPELKRETNLEDNTKGWF